MVNQHFSSLLSSLSIAGFLWTLPACQDLLSFSLLDPTPVFPSGPVVYIILSNGHSQSDWCQLSLKWQCCRVRNSGLWSLVWVPWPLFGQHSLPNLDTVTSSRTLFWLLFSPLSLSEHGVKADSCFIRVLGCQSWHFLRCSILSGSCKSSKKHTSKTFTYFW